MKTEFHLMQLEGKAVRIVESEPNVRVCPGRGMTYTTYPTLAEATAAIATLHLVPYITPADKLNWLFSQLSAETQATYGVLYGPVQVLIQGGNFKGAATVLRSIRNVPTELQSILIQMVKILEQA